MPLKGLATIFLVAVTQANGVLSGESDKTICLEMVNNVCLLSDKSYPL